MSLPRKRLAPPRLLICYSSCDGPAHVRAVMQLGGFIQQHMATQVSGRHISSSIVLRVFCKKWLERLYRSLYK